MVGGWYNNLASSSSYSPFLMRLTSTGVFDTSFNTTGIFIQTSDELINDVILQSDNKIIAISNLNSKFGVSKFNTDGSFDTTFGCINTFLSISFIS